MIAKCDYLFTEGMMMKYITMRDLRGVKRFSVISSGIFALVTIFFIARLIFFKSLLAILLILLFGTCMVVSFRTAIGQPSAGAEKLLLKKYFECHGVLTESSARPWIFHQIVNVTETGITIRYANKDASMEKGGNFLKVTKRWDEWHDVKIEGDMIVVMAAPPVNPGFALLGWDGALSAIANRRCDDAVIIKSALEGMKFEALYKYIRKRVQKELPIEKLMP